MIILRSAGKTMIYIVKASQRLQVGCCPCIWIEVNLN